MAHYTVHYRFSQSFPFSPQDAYAWAADYDPDDFTLMGKDGRRRIQRIDQDTLILDDTVFEDGRTTRKRRLIRLFPELLTLTNTRLSSPNKHSQFIYQFVAEGEGGSRLEFTGAQVNEAERRPTPAKIAALAEEYTRVDSGLWVHLTRAMGKDLAGRPR
jgi:hypothetical protein